LAAFFLSVRGSPAGLLAGLAPVRADIGANEAAARTDEALAERGQLRLVRQEVTVELGPVVAPNRVPAVASRRVTPCERMWPMVTGSNVSRVRRVMLTTSSEAETHVKILTPTHLRRNRWTLKSSGKTT
jgi:hypothetical protein